MLLLVPLAQGIYITSGATINTLITATNSQNATLTGIGSTGTYLVSINQTVGSSGSPIAMTGTGAGYVQVSGTYGLAIPVGTSAQRPSLAYTTTGMMRFNTDQQYVELYNGTAWASIAGAGGGVTTTQANDIALGIVMSLG